MHINTIIVPLRKKVVNKMNLMNICKQNNNILFENDENKHNTVESLIKEQLPKINQIETQGCISDN